MSSITPQAIAANGASASSSSRVTLSALNSMPSSQFVSTLASIYEKSSWVAAGVVDQRPFISLSALQSAMAKYVASAPESKQLELIRSHPELALKGKPAQEMTQHSKNEQATSGMSSLSESEQKQFSGYSKRYREKHGFPFIIAVLTLDRAAIVRSCGERIYNSTPREIKRALAEIDKIAEIRLRGLIVDESSSSSEPFPRPQPLGATRSSAGTELMDVQYGKSRVRVLKVLRAKPHHEIIECDVQVLLRGALNSSFTHGDNSLVVPTDTCKNTVIVVARQSLNDSIEEFGSAIGSHFLNQYAHLSSVDVKIVEKPWHRISVATETQPGVFNGESKPSPYAFQHRGPERPFTHVVSTRRGVWIESGITEYMILETTQSAFRDFPRCPLTLLPETDDRIFSTKISATWSWSQTPAAGFRASNALILKTMLDRWATRWSMSVQATVYEMVLDVFAAQNDVAFIKVTLPNVHFLQYNMSPFGLENNNTVYIPTDEPHGTIELKVARSGKKVEVNSSDASAEALKELVFPTARPCTALPPRPKL